MIHKRRVILAGKSIILGAVWASLARYPQLEIMAQVARPEAAALQALTPDVILFDVAAGLPEGAFALLQQRPNLLLLGLNPDDDQLLLWRSAQRRVASAEEIVGEIAHLLET